MKRGGESLRRASIGVSERIVRKEHKRNGRSWDLYLACAAAAGDGLDIQVTCESAVRAEISPKRL